MVQVRGAPPSQRARRPCHMPGEACAPAIPARTGSRTDRVRRGAGPRRLGGEAPKPGSGKVPAPGGCASGLGSCAAEISGRAARSGRPGLLCRLGLPCPEVLFPRFSSLKRRSSAMFARLSTTRRTRAGTRHHQAPQAHSPQLRAVAQAPIRPRATPRAARRLRLGPRTDAAKTPASAARRCTYPMCSTHSMDVSRTTHAPRLSSAQLPAPDGVMARCPPPRRTGADLSRPPAGRDRPSTLDNRRSAGRSKSPRGPTERHAPFGRRRFKRLTPLPRSPCRGPASSVPAGRASRSGGCVPASDRVPCRPRSGCARGRRRCRTAS